MFCICMITSRHRLKLAGTEVARVIVLEWNLFLWFLMNLAVLSSERKVDGCARYGFDTSEPVAEYPQHIFCLEGAL